TIQDDRVMIQQVQGRQVQNHVGNGTPGNPVGMVRNNAARHGKFQEKLLLIQAQENGQILEEEQLAFLADPGILDGQATHITIPQNAAFQTKDLDAYDSDCDDLSSAKAVPMANLLSFNSDVLSKDIMNIVTSCAVNESVNMSNCINEKCSECLELETELLKRKYFIEKDVYDKLVKSYSTLKQHCISLELATQLNQEICQRDNSGVNQNGPTFNQLFELKELKAQSQEKDTEKVFAIAALKNELRKIKGKNVVDIDVSTPNATTIAPGMFKLDIKPISHGLKSNRTVYET
ncbi:hypothetical protein Tco_1040550, partial [Tanacetum coccineum]